MKNIYYAKDIINGLVQEISLGTKVIMKTEPRFKRKFIKGKLIKNDDNCIGIDYPKELGGTFLSREAIEYIKILEKGSNNMSKKEQLLNELEQIKKEFKEKIENVQKQIEKEDNKKEWWTPKENEIYWYIHLDGKVYYQGYEDDEFNKQRIENLNYYKTKDKAKRIAFEQLLHRNLEKFAFENNEREIDWNNNSLKYSIAYNYDSKELIIDETRDYKYISETYFISEEVAEKAMREFKDDLIRYFTSDK